MLGKNKNSKTPKVVINNLIKKSEKMLKKAENAKDLKTRMIALRHLFKIKKTLYMNTDYNEQIISSMSEKNKKLLNKLNSALKKDPGLTHYIYSHDPKYKEASNRTFIIANKMVDDCVKLQSKLREGVKSIKQYIASTKKGMKYESKENKKIFKYILIKYKKLKKS